MRQVDFEWASTDEPHKSRRKEILAKYPEIKNLMGHDPRMKYFVLFMVCVQICSAYLIRDVNWTTILLVAYVFGGVINHSMALAIHEISHNLAFGHLHPVKNRALAIFGNLIMGVPYAVAFKKYHLEHHKYQGDDMIDVDIPCRLEAKLFRGTFFKLIWVILQPFFYTLRPICIRPKPITSLEVMNVSAQFIFNFIIWYLMGYKSLIYLIAGSLLAMGLHPMAGHFISEHYMFEKGIETYSYYGPLNLITFNVGYHNEHHDFPNIPGSRLPEVRKIAREYYDNLPSHNSWTLVIWNFITDPNIGLYSRVRRHPAIDGQSRADEDDQGRLEGERDCQAEKER